MAKTIQSCMNENIHVLLLWWSHYQEGKVVIEVPLIGLTRHILVPVLSQQLDFQRNNSFVLSFKTFSGDINVTWRSILSVAYRWQKIVLAIKICFKVDYCLCIVVSNTYWIVFLFCCSSSCTPYVANFSGLFNFDCPFGILQRFSFTELIYYTYDICPDYYSYDMHRDQD